MGERRDSHSVVPEPVETGRELHVYSVGDKPAYESLPIADAERARRHYHAGSPGRANGLGGICSRLEYGHIRDAVQPFGFVTDHSR